MSGYIYNLIQSTASGKVELLNSSTRKYEITRFIDNDYLKVGLSIAPLTVIRSRDGRPNSAVFIDPYEFMQIDLGEE
jgi:hypothetical protein